MTWIWQTSHNFTNAKSNFSVKFYDSSVQLNRIGVSTHILGDVVTLRDSFGLAFCHRDHFTNGLCEWHLENQHYRHLNSNRENRKPKYLQIKKRSWQTICQSILCILKAPECPHRRAWVGLGIVPPRPPSPHIRQPTSRGWSTPWQGVWTSRQADKQTIRQADKQTSRKANHGLTFLSTKVQTFSSTCLFWFLTTHLHFSTSSGAQTFIQGQVKGVWSDF